MTQPENIAPPEQIARIINPSAWNVFDNAIRPFAEQRGAHGNEAPQLYGDMWKAGVRTAEQAREYLLYRDDTPPLCVDIAWLRVSLTKANEILALSLGNGKPEVSEGVDCPQRFKGALCRIGWQAIDAGLREAFTATIEFEAPPELPLDVVWKRAPVVIEVTTSKEHSPALEALEALDWLYAGTLPENHPNARSADGDIDRQTDEDAYNTIRQALSPTKPDVSGSDATDTSRHPEALDYLNDDSTDPYVPWGDAVSAISKALYERDAARAKPEVSGSGEAEDRASPLSDKPACASETAESERQASPVDVQGWRGIVQRLVNMSAGIQADLQSAHQGRSDAASEWMREDDREQRRDFMSLVTDAQALLSASPQPADAGWQDIASAPKDGRPILVRYQWQGKNRFMVIRRSKDKNWWIRDDGQQVVHNDDAKPGSMEETRNLKPTLWSELPKPDDALPAAPQTGGEG